MISIFYTGDRRHNAKVAEQNHARLFDEIRRLDDVQIDFYTKDFAGRGVCPFDEGGADVRLRRGEGGAVQVWDFVTGVDRSVGDIVIRMRTDTWFTESSIAVIIEHVKKIIAGERDIAFFGSDLVNDNQGQEHRAIEIANGDPPRIQDFLIIARRDRLTPSDKVIQHLLDINPRKRRSGNKSFRDIVPANVSACTVLCHIWLIRQWYDQYPTNHQVCHDYIYSYVDDGKNVDDILQPALDWLETYP